LNYSARGESRPASRRFERPLAAALLRRDVDRSTTGIFRSVKAGVQRFELERLLNSQPRKRYVVQAIQHIRRGDSSRFRARRCACTSTRTISLSRNGFNKAGLTSSKPAYCSQRYNVSLESRCSDAMLNAAPRNPRARIIHEEDAAAADKPIFPSTITKREITAVPQDAGSIASDRERERERERERASLSRIRTRAVRRIDVSLSIRRG